MKENFIMLTVTRPTKINDIFKKKQLPELKHSQISNYMQRLKNDLLHPIKTYEEFLAWCETKNKNHESEPDSPIIIKYEATTDQYPTNSLRAVFSSRRLLSGAENVQSINADATYKLNIFGLPVIIIGSTDRRRHFHPLCIAVSTTEKSEDFAFVFHSLKNAIEKELQHDFSPAILIADAADSITNGFETTFGTEFKRVVCWAHVVRNIVKKMKELRIDEELRNQILNDIRMIQRSESSVIFNASCKLFEKKWNAYNSHPVVSFVKYFRVTWVRKGFEWTAATTLRYPVTNNALESVNKSIKDFYTLRKKLVFREFLESLLKIVCDWSTTRNPSSPNFKKYFTDVEVSNDLKKKSIQWKSEASKKGFKQFLIVVTIILKEI